METKANHVLIGAFALVVITAAFGFVIWLAKIQIDQERAYYDIYFEESVSGLSVAGDVRYQGIKVGQVTDIQIAPARQGEVRVRIEVDAETPVKTDTVARLEYQGVTGVAFVQLTGGSDEAELLRVASADEIPVIQSQESAISALFAGAPELIDRAVILVSRLSELVSEENQQSITNLLNNFETVSDSVAGRSAEIEELIVNANRMSADLAETSKNLNQLAARLDKVAQSTDEVVNEDLKNLLADARSAARSIDAAGTELTLLVEESRPAVRDFSAGGLQQFSQFITEARTLVATLERLADRVESDPARFLLGTQAEEYEP